MTLIEGSMFGCVWGRGREWGFLGWRGMAFKFEFEMRIIVLKSQDLDFKYIQNSSAFVIAIFKVVFATKAIFRILLTIEN